MGREIDLKKAARYVAEQKARIACQEALLARMRNRRDPTRSADDQLELMLDVLAQWEAHLKELTRWASG